MKKKTYWKALLKNFPELNFLSWLEVLPVYNDKGEAIKCCNPIVHFDPKQIEYINAQLKKLGHQFINSTVWYPDGQYFPREHIDRAIGFYFPS